MSSPALVDSVLHTIGHTPLVRLRRLVEPGMADVVVKLEYFNPTGSYKDRLALAMVEGAEKRGTLKPGMQVIEYTGGSTGSSLAMVCAMKGYTFHPLSSDAFSAEKLDTMRAFGAELEREVREMLQEKEEKKKSEKDKADKRASPLRLAQV
jgi:cysteine synthase A